MLEIMDSEDLRLLPQTRFYGSKRKHLAWMYDCLARYQFETALDLFGGTGSVSMLFERMGKDVAYHDSALFNTRQASALFGALSARDLVKVENVIRGIKPGRGLITSNFEGDYFTQEENRWLDGFLSSQLALKSSSVRDATFYCVAQACLQKRPYNLFHRKNLSMRLNAKGQRFGNATTWAKAFEDLALSHLKVLAKYVERERRGRVIVLQPKKPSAVVVRRDLVYIDPPYIRTDRTTETYTQRYHFLEGLSDPARWSKYLAANEGDQYASTAMRERWSDKREIANLLERVVTRHAESIVAVSYMGAGFPSVAQIRAIMRPRFRRVSVYQRDVKRALSNVSCSEVLLVGEP